MRDELRDLEINGSDIQLFEEIGLGEFGVVMHGIATRLPSSDSSLQSVAVKIMKQQSSDSVSNGFVREALRLRGLDHANVIKLLAVRMRCEPFYIVLEFMSNGDLKTLLRQCHAQEGLLSTHHLVKFALDISLGFEYLQQMRFVHRDLAARNVLVSGIFQAKIGDFGIMFSHDWWSLFWLMMF